MAVVGQGQERHRLSAAVAWTINSEVAAFCFKSVFAAIERLESDAERESAIGAK